MIEVKNVTKEFKKQGRTILLASHNRDDIEMLCDEVNEQVAKRIANFRFDFIHHPSQNGNVQMICQSNHNGNLNRELDVELPQESMRGLTGKR
jgi:ABC-type uncharacterized transport system ATPase subunit